MIAYGLMYRLGLVPWERREVAESWRPMVDRADALVPGRALDVGCRSGRDAVYLAKRGWRITAVDFVEKALASGEQPAACEGVEVQWVKGDEGELARLGLEPGYSLYDFGCIHGLSDSARRGAAEGLSALASPGATLLFFAFKAGRRIVLPRGMDKDDAVALLDDRWSLEQSQSVMTDDMPPPFRRANPTVYRLTRDAAAASSASQTA